MRLWTVHPHYLDAKGLVALWRETLLAQKVLRGQTRGYKAHPQLARFREQSDPLASVATYLAAIAAEARARGYNFNTTKIGRRRRRTRIDETRGQLLHEWKHLLRKLKSRSPERYRALKAVAEPDPHPLFRVVPGRVREWERI